MKNIKINALQHGGWKKAQYIPPESITYSQIQHKTKENQQEWKGTTAPAAFVDSDTLRTGLDKMVLKTSRTFLTLQLPWITLLQAAKINIGEDQCNSRLGHI